MKSLILTALYLAKDTLNRWVSRISSPLARVLVVFFLSLCALCFLGSYVITAKALRDKIRTQGGDLVHLMIFSGPGTNSFAIPTQQEMEDLLDVDSWRCAAWAPPWPTTTAWLSSPTIFPAPSSSCPCSPPAEAPACSAPQTSRCSAPARLT